MTKIYHNPRCRKSRETLQILRDEGIEPQIIEYLINPPTAEELKALLKKMEMNPIDIIRKGEEIYKSGFKGKEFIDEEWIDILVKNPKLIERPIVLHDGKAVLGRPPEKVRTIL